MDELLNREKLYSLREVQIIVEDCSLSGHFSGNALPDSGKHYNTKQPHTAIGHHRSPPKTIVQMQTRPTIH